MGAYSHIISARLNVDLPSFEDTSIYSKYDIFERTSVWEGLSSIISIGFLKAQAIAQSLVFIAVLYQQRSMIIYVIMTFLPTFLRPNFGNTLWELNTSKSRREKLLCMLIDHIIAWAATCQNSDYISMAAANHSAHSNASRKEIIVGNLQKYIIQSG